MREIKFRAWDHRKRRWLDDADFLVSSVGTVLLYDIQYGSKLGNLTGKWREDEEGTIQLVCFTGLKDMNGVEIFEGDVVRYKIDKPDVVLFENCRFTLSNSASRFPMGDDMAGDIEVIGNIYENPELLARS